MGSSVHYAGLPRIIEATLRSDRPDLPLNSGRSSTRIRPMDNDSHMIERFRHGAEPESDARHLSRPLVVYLTTLADVRARTPARILTGRAGPAYRTTTWLELRSDHAAARDAVRTELDLNGDLGAPFVAEWGLFEVATLAHTKEEFLLRPDLGRSLSDMARSRASPSLLPWCRPSGSHRRWAIGRSGAGPGSRTSPSACSRSPPPKLALRSAFFHPARPRGHAQRYWRDP